MKSTRGSRALLTVWQGNLSRTIYITPNELRHGRRVMPKGKGYITSLLLTQKQKLKTGSLHNENADKPKGQKCHFF
jgi:hypothetical protein